MVNYLLAQRMDKKTRHGIITKRKSLHKSNDTGYRMKGLNKNQMK